VSAFAIGAIVVFSEVACKREDSMPAPTTSQKRELVDGHALFGGLSKADLDALLSRARVEHYLAGQKIFEKGAPGRSMMAILSGSVRISTPSSTSRELVLAILQPGEVFGEIALLDGLERTADATAVADCELLVLERREFIPFLERRPDVSMQLLRVFCHRLRHTDEQVEHAVFERLDSRLAKTLIRLASIVPQGAKAGPAVSLRVSQQELADMVGATRESVNKKLHVWQMAGFIRLEKRLIVILDIAYVKDLA
jgi:CRP/FNR family cyclic AMP-dependent transcriptional regulator